MRLLLLAVLLLPLPALAEEWTDYANSETLDKFQYDKQTVYRQSDGHVRVWTKTSNLNELVTCLAKCNEMRGDLIEPCLAEKKRLCPGGKPRTSLEPILYEFSCTGQFRTLSDEKTGDWLYIKPNMYIAALDRTVCK